MIHLFVKMTTWSWGKAEVWCPSPFGTFCRFLWRVGVVVGVVICGVVVVWCGWGDVGAKVLWAAGSRARLSTWVVQETD